MTDLFEPTTAANPAAPKPRRCWRHQALRVHFVTNDDRELWHVEQQHYGYLSACEPGMICTRCYKRLDQARIDRGRRSRNRGNAIERGVAKQLGLRRVGQYGGPTDVGNAAEPFRVSVKSGSGYFSERYWDQLKRQVVNANQTALLVVTDAPGPGRRRRAMVVLSLEDWTSLHGSSGVEDVPA